MRANKNLVGICIVFSMVSCASARLAPGPFDLPDIQIPQPGQRNVLVIIGDDLGIDVPRQYRSITGNPLASLPATPNIRDLANSGVTFDNAWANPVCSPTRAGVLTGRHSFRTTVANALPNGALFGLPDSETTLPESISIPGVDYVSALFGKWHLGPGVSGPYYGPLDQGFADHLGSIDGALADYAAWDKYENGMQVDGNIATPVVDPVTTYATLDTADDAINWINSQTGRWLAIVAFNAPHTPLHTPTLACDGVSSPLADFNAMIECMDEHIGRLLTGLANQNQLANTTVIFIGDNGTEGSQIRAPFNANAESHKGNVYEGGIRVPFIVADGYHLVNSSEAPVSTGIGRIINPGRRSDALVNTVDIFATVAAIAGVQSQAEDSYSLIRYMAPVYRVPVAPQREYMYSDRCTSSLFQAAIRDRQYKLIYKYPGTLVGQPDLELYDVADLAESTALNDPVVEALLLGELQSMWDSEGFDPSTGACP